MNVPLTMEDVLRYAPILKAPSNALVSWDTLRKQTIQHVLVRTRLEKIEEIKLILLILQIWMSVPPIMEDVVRLALTIMVLSSVLVEQGT